MSKNNRKVRILLDAMGGDFAPTELIKGAVIAAKKHDDIEITLVGPENMVASEMAKYNGHNPRLRHIGAEGFIREGESESAALAVQTRPDASIAVAIKALKSGEADAVLTAGPTAALVGSAIRYLGMIDGLERPVIGGSLSGIAPDTVMMDCGVNVDCKPYHLLTFAIMGCIYAKMFLNIDNPSVALLNIGAEENKGSRLVREAYALLKGSGLNFIGNVEGNEIFAGKANVIVCDGFVGNILFKFTEGGVDIIYNWLKRKLRFFPFHSLFRLLSRDLTSLTNMPESAGSGIIWGVDGIALKMHGASRAAEVAEKIAQARLVVKMDVLGSIKSEIAAIGTKVKV